jgi:hypothetical protein
MQTGTIRDSRTTIFLRSEILQAMGVAVRAVKSMPERYLTTRVCRMGYFLAIVMLTSVGITVAQSSPPSPKPDQDAGTQSTPGPDSSSDSLPPLPPIPPGKSTVIGGAIHDVDPIRDQFTLKVFGGKSMKILFDERTQVYRDGKKTPLRDLRAIDHASIETVLDGTSVFALSVHMLSQIPEGERQGEVLNYDPGTHELTVSDTLGRDPIKLSVPATTAVIRQGQAASSSQGLGASDLVKGTLISVKFASDMGRGVASQIAILAIPGSSFVFNGNITFLNLRSKLFVLLDSTNDKSYKIVFDPARFPISRNLQEGAHVTVTATFDGGNYVASAITVK